MPSPHTETMTLPDGTSIEGERVGVDVSTERWSEYTLADGTVLRAKATLVSTIRVPHRYDPQGNPFYVIQATVTTTVVSSPRELMRPS